MNQKNFDMALGHVDPDLVEEHLSERTARTAGRRAPRRALAVAAAACAAVVVLGGAGIALSRTGGALGDIPPGGDETSPGQSVSRLAPLRIYYLAADGSVQSEVQNLPAHDPESLLGAWREMNGLSEAEAEAVLSCMELAESEETVDGETRRVYRLSMNTEESTSEEAELGYTYLETVSEAAQYRVVEWATNEEDGDRVISYSGDWDAFVEQLIGEMNQVVVETETDEAGRTVRVTKYRPYDGSMTVIEYDEQGRADCSVYLYFRESDVDIPIEDYFSDRLFSVIPSQDAESNLP